ncbi:hypothetical protein LUZ63_004121 [Rhynchospora breviuscula]|uniref:Pentatricopeptide repeat-containing protein n=1 Tax=Rhynchospora breviuscula TaxID=2022672 RepID=A0A9Q0D1Y0_9POAL|nr:hypothetical protein LUZ63_004121 [Rhynchospora breviuscula]
MWRIIQFPLKHPLSINRLLTSLHHFQFYLFSTSTNKNKTIKRAKTNNREELSSYYDDPFTLCKHIKASTDSPITGGAQAHSLVIKLGYNANPYIATALMSVYSETGLLDDAHKVFDELPNRTDVCWTSLISAYEWHGYPRRALEIFRHMQLDNVDPDRVTITVAISACTALGALDLGSWIYTYICRNWGKESILEDLILQNALINMYAKCGDVKAARCIFDTAKQRDITTWTSMVMGYALHGPAVEALHIFYIMEKELVPNHVAFLGALMACNHAGLVDEAWRYFERMEKEYRIKPKITHFGCMVDMLCRMGLLEDAYRLIMDMPMKPNAMIWRSLLGACSDSGNITLASQARACLAELESGYAGDDVAMSNAYAKLGYWEEKTIVRDRVKRRRQPGCSLIEIGSRTREFAISDGVKCEHNELKEIIKGLTENSKSLLGDSENFTFSYVDLDGG